MAWRHRGRTAEAKAEDMWARFSILGTGAHLESPCGPTAARATEKATATKSAVPTAPRKNRGRTAEVPRKTTAEERIMLTHRKRTKHHPPHIYIYIYTYTMVDPCISMHRVKRSRVMCNRVPCHRGHSFFEQHLRTQLRTSRVCIEYFRV